MSCLRARRLIDDRRWPLCMAPRSSDWKVAAAVYAPTMHSLFRDALTTSYTRIAFLPAIYFYGFMPQQQVATVTTDHFSDHFSGPGRAVGPLCVCLCVCSHDKLSNEMTFDLDIRHGGSPWLNTGHVCRWTVKVTRPQSSRLELGLGLGLGLG